MQELRLVLIIVGALAIAALLLHGLWSSRKEKPAKFGEKPLGKLGESDNVDADGFDRDGVGSVRVVSSDTQAAEPARPERKEPELHFSSTIEADPLMESNEQEFDSHPIMDLPKMSAQPAATVEAEKANSASQPQEVAEAVQAAAEPAPSMPEVKSQPLQQPVEPVVTQAEELSPPVLKTADEMIVVEPSEEPLEPETAKQDVEPAVETEEVTVVPEPEPELVPSYLVLNVHARNGEVLRGTRLFNSLEQNNLIYGENSVYHRHSDLAGTEPVIFSVTNMVHPGYFPEGGGDNFETPGIAFYLMLPCHGRADHNFNLMLQTVQCVADELGADILDHERVMITPQRIDEYREKAKLYTRT